MKAMGKLFCILVLSSVAAGSGAQEGAVSVPIKVFAPDKDGWVLHCNGADRIADVVGGWRDVHAAGLRLFTGGLWEVAAKDNPATLSYYRQMPGETCQVVRPSDLKS